jgi:hypothetical protein
MLVYSNAYDSADDEVYRLCLKCGSLYLAYYWDSELEAYIYLTKEGDVTCPKCITPFTYSLQ